MKKMLVSILVLPMLCLSIAGCAGDSDNGRVAPGHYISDELVAQMRADFNAVAQEGFAHPIIKSFDDVRVVIIAKSALPPFDPFAPPPDSFVYHNFREIIPPNEIRVALPLFSVIWKDDMRALLSSVPNGTSLLPAGIFIDETLVLEWRQKYEEMKVCSGLGGVFSELAITVTVPRWECIPGIQCAGQFSQPNKIHIGVDIASRTDATGLWFEDLMKHEYVHELLFRNTGDPDASHQSSLYRNCAEWFP